MVRLSRLEFVFAALLALQASGFQVRPTRTFRPAVVGTTGGSPASSNVDIRSTRSRRRRRTSLFVSLTATVDVSERFRRSRNSTDYDGFSYTPTQQQWWKQRSSPSKSPTAVEQPQQFKLYCDLDGVLVDFEHGIRKLFPDLESSLTLQDLERSTMWSRVAKADAFFERLPWTRHGRRLWKAIRHLQPDILTGVPYHRTSRVEKFHWCLRELGNDVEVGAHIDMAGHSSNHVCVNGVQRKEGAVNVITCWSTNKYHESGPGRVLIDDRLSLKADWEAAGGIFVHHTNVDETLEQLVQLGILQQDNSQEVCP